MDTTTKEQRNKFGTSEILRCLVYIAAIIFLLSCVAFQAFFFMDHLEMKQKWATMDGKVTSLELATKSLVPSSPPQNEAKDNKHGFKDLHVRLRRIVALSLQSLEKRLKVLEIR